MTVKYLVASPGRSGSLYVARAISRSTGLRIISDAETHKDVTTPVIYHTHHATLQLADDDLTVVCCTRKDLYATTISAIIGEVSNEWGKYTGNQKPFTVSRDMVEQKYVWNRWWQQQFDTLNTYKNKVYLGFEEFTKNPNVIFDTLNIPAVDVPVIKSPYTEQHIVNIDEVKQWIGEIEKDPTLEDFALNTFQWHNGKVDD